MFLLAETKYRRAERGWRLWSQKNPPKNKNKTKFNNMTWLWYLNRNSLSKSQPKRIPIFIYNTFIFLQYYWGMPYSHFQENIGKFAMLIIFLYSTLSLWLMTNAFLHHSSYIEVPYVHSVLSTVLLLYNTGILPFIQIDTSAKQAVKLI